LNVELFVVAYATQNGTFGKCVKFSNILIGIILYI